MPLDSALAFHPIEYILPKQPIIGFSVPFSEDLPYEPLPTLDESTPSIASDLISEPAKDLQYVKFKRSPFKLPQTADNTMPSSLELDEFATMVLEITPKVTKAHYAKPKIKVKRIRLGGEIQQDEVDEIQNSVIAMETHTASFKRPQLDQWNESVTLDQQDVIQEVPKLEQLVASNRIEWPTLLNLLTKIWSSDSMDYISSETLQHLESMAQSILINLYEPTLDQSLLSAGSILTILLTYGIQKGRIYSETSLRCTFDMLKQLQKRVLPLYTSPESPDSLRPILLDYWKLLDLLTMFIRDTRVSDMLITNLEYFAFAYIFADPTDGTLSASLERIRTASSNLLLSIARKYPDQQNFLIKETFNNLSKSTSTTLVRLSRGSSVQLISQFLVQLVQTPDCSQFHFEDSFWSMVGSRTSARQSQRKLVKQVVDGFLKEIANHTLESGRLAREITIDFITRASSMTPDVRPSLEGLINDLLVMLDYPEYAGAETILSQFVDTLLNVEGNVALQSFVFEMAGRIASRILEIKLKDAKGGSPLQVLSYLQRRGGFWYFYTKTLATINQGEPDDIRKKVLPYVQVMNNNYSVLEDADSNAYNSILTRSELVGQYIVILSKLVANLGNDQIKLRHVAIKNLSLLLDKQPMLLASKSLKSVITKLLQGSSASVSGSILDMLQGFLQGHPEMAPEFAVVSASKINDRSIAVRKKAIGLSTFIFDVDPASRRGISQALLTRLDDEDPNVTRAAVEALTTAWFDTTDTDSAIDSILPAGDYFERFLKAYALDDDYNARQSLGPIVERVVELATENDSKVAQYMGFLAIVARSDASLLSQDQLLSLQPYLADDSASSEWCFYTLQLFQIALPRMISLNPRFIKDCQQSLVSRLTKFNSKELPLAMECIWTLAKRSRTTDTVARAADNTLTLLRKSPNMRLLYLAGSFGKVCNLEKHRDLFHGIGETETITSFIIRHILPHCKDAKLGKAAVRNLLFVCITYPRLFLSKEVLSIMDNAFAMDAQDIAIDTLALFLQSEEDKATTNGTLHSYDKVDLAAFHGDSVQNINDSICSSLVQRYLNNVLEACASQNRPLRAVEFIDLVVKLGFINPKLCYPTVVGLETSDDAHIRRMALDIHRKLHDRYESLLEPLITKALKQAVRYRKRHSSDLLYDGFLRSFLDIIKMNSSPRKMARVYQTIGDTFRQINVDKVISSIKKCGMARDYAIFMAINLNRVEFTTQEEVLSVVNAINRVTSSQIPNLMASDYEDEDKIEPLAKSLLALCRLQDVLLSNYGFTDDTLIKYHESDKKREFRKGVKRTGDDEVVLDEGELTELMDRLGEYA